jgi:hypothetical protein
MKTTFLLSALFATGLCVNVGKIDQSKAASGGGGSRMMRARDVWTVSDDLNIFDQQAIPSTDTHKLVQRQC